MLTGINPLLTGEMLLHLDHMGHSDAVLVADAHFPAWALGQRVIDAPGLTVPELVEAITSVVPVDDAPGIDLMTSAEGSVLPVQTEVLAAAGVPLDGARFIERFAYYEVAKTAYLVVRSGETRVYANALVRKGVVRAFRKETSDA